MPTMRPWLITMRRAASALPSSRGWAARAADEGEALADLHREIERQRLRQIADAPAHLERPAHDVETGDRGRALAGDEVRGEDAHGRGLARAVAAEQADDLALLRAER